MIDYVGAGRFLWATDYPHSDHGADYMEEVRALASALTADVRRRVLGENVARLYCLS